MVPLHDDVCSRQTVVRTVIVTVDTILCVLLYLIIPHVYPSFTSNVDSVGSYTRPRYVHVS